MSARTAVLIHGCHLQAEEWEAIVFGKGNCLGRVPKGIEVAISKNAELIFWGSGASQNPQGMKEAEYIYTQTLGPKLQDLATRIKKDPESLSAYLKKVSHVDQGTQNTADEIRVASELCAAKGITELFLVSSPTHIARCLQEACKYKEAHPQTTLNFFATPCETCFAQSTAADVLILEPPHRGDLPRTFFHKTLRRIFPFMRTQEKADALNGELSKVIDKFEKEVP